MLGERFAYCRGPAASPEDAVLAALMADESAGRQRETRGHRLEAVAQLFHSLDTPDELAPLDDDERTRVVNLAALGSRCAPMWCATVGYGTSTSCPTRRPTEVVRPASPVPRRTLAHRYSDRDRLGVLTRAALDDMHPDRRQVIDYLLANSGTHATAAIAGHCGLLPTTSRRHLEDLVAQRVLDLVGDNLERWCSSEWLHGYWPAGVG